MKSNQHGYCKHCGANFDGNYVLEEMLYRSSNFEEALYWTKHYEGYDEFGIENKFGAYFILYHRGFLDSNIKCLECGEEQ